MRLRFLIFRGGSKKGENYNRNANNEEIFVKEGLPRGKITTETPKTKKYL